MAKIPYRLYLTEDQMPRQWYNLRADMKEQPDPLIHPGTHEPLPVEALYPIFCGAAGNGLHHTVFRYPGTRSGDV